MAENQKMHTILSTVAPLTTIRFSQYFEKLDPQAKARYESKVKMCGFDPYHSELKRHFKNDTSLWPEVEYPDIVNYLVLQTSWASKEEMKAYKSLEAYNFFVSGWVKSIVAKPVGRDKVVLFSRVNHSQRVSETPLMTWILSEKNGTVITAHCNCMAGLSEACSHVGATLFAVEAGVRMSKTTCTQEKCTWLMPSYIKEIPYKRVCEVDFSSAKKKHRQVDQHDRTPMMQVFSSAAATVKRTTKEEEDDFFKALAKSSTRPAILSLIPEYSDSYVPQNDHLPKPLTCLYNKANLTSSSQDLLNLCQGTQLSITTEECHAIEAATRSQSSSRLWFQQRAGRITASRFKSACHTNPIKPSKSLIKTTCYPEAHQFSSLVTIWGCSHEKDGRKEYEKQMQLHHDNFYVGNNGFHINPKWPHLGATPDGIVGCDCCGKGICEIKCPFCHKDGAINDIASDKRACLINNGGKICLDHKHSYYYQVQAQIHITEAEYCDFVVWTSRDVHIERILPDIQFWEVNLPKATSFFQRGILPELLAKWFTQPAGSSVATRHLSPNRLQTSSGATCSNGAPTNWSCKTFLLAEE